MQEKKRIFIADDDQAALSSLRRLLEVSGFLVESTADSREAPERIKTFGPDLILLDLLMPHLGGFEICEILNASPQTQGIPVIITSAIGGFSDVKRAYKLGVVGYFTKPYDFPELLKEINKAIAYKQSKATS